MPRRVPTREIPRRSVGSPPLNVRIERLAHAEDLPLPATATALSAGLDLAAAIEDELVLAPGQRELVPTGFAIALPEGYEAQVRPRSGLALRHGIVMPNAPGTIDADYRGEVGVILINLSNENFTIENGERVAQLVVAKYEQATSETTEELSSTHRGEGGFGSTGVK